MKSFDGNLSQISRLVLATKVKFNFAIMAAGFPSDCIDHRIYYNNPIDLPSLHVYGETDKVIPIGSEKKIAVAVQLLHIFVAEFSKKLQSIFVNPRTIEHPGGHYLPAAAPQKASYDEFLKSMLLGKLK